jgi:hypothetical protein
MRYLAMPLRELVTDGVNQEIVLEGCACADSRVEEFQLIDIGRHAPKVARVSREYYREPNRAV